MRDATFDAIPAGGGVSGMWGMRERPRLRRGAPIGASCMSRVGKPPRGITAPPQVPAVIRGRPSLPRRTTAPPSPVVRRMGPTAGIWRGCGGLLADRSCERTCITRQSSAFAPALPCYACHTCVVRHGLAGSARLSSYACSPRRDRFPGRPHPPSGARRYPRTPRPRPGGTDAPPQASAVKNPIRPKTTEESGTTPAGHGRPAERPPAWPARHPASPRPGQPGVIRLDAERSEAPKTSRRGARPCGTRRRSPSPPGP